MIENCGTFDKSSVSKSLTPWGLEVNHRLLNRKMKHKDLLAVLEEEGYKMSKPVLSNLLHGLGIKNKEPIIQFISDYLGISIVLSEAGEGNGAEADESGG